MLGQWSDSPYVFRVHRGVGPHMPDIPNNSHCLSFNAERQGTSQTSIFISTLNDNYLANL